MVLDIRCECHCLCRFPNGGQPASLSADKWRHRRKRLQLSVTVSPPAVQFHPFNDFVRFMIIRLRGGNVGLSAAAKRFSKPSSLPTAALLASRRLRRSAATPLAFVSGQVALQRLQYHVDAECP